MEELLLTIAKRLVDNPEVVTVHKAGNSTQKSCIYIVNVAERDIPFLIGKEGKMIKSIRIIAKAIGRKEGSNVFVEIQEKE